MVKILKWIMVYVLKISLHINMKHGFAANGLWTSIEGGFFF